MGPVVGLTIQQFTPTLTLPRQGGGDFLCLHTAPDAVYVGHPNLKIKDLPV